MEKVFLERKYYFNHSRSDIVYLQNPDASECRDVMDMMNNMIGPIGMLLAGMVIGDVPLRLYLLKKKLSFNSIAIDCLSNICTDSNETDSYICRNK